MYPQAGRFDDLGDTVWVGRHALVLTPNHAMSFFRVIRRVVSSSVVIVQMCAL